MPKRFTSNSLLIVSSLVSSKQVMAPYPALLTSTSIRPNLATAASAASSYIEASGMEISSGICNTLSLYSADIAIPFSFRVVATTQSPAFRAAIAVAIPIPFPAPVINHTFDMLYPLLVCQAFIYLLSFRRRTLPYGCQEPLGMAGSVPPHIGMSTGPLGSFGRP